MARLAWNDEIGYVANVRFLEAKAKVETNPCAAADNLDSAEGDPEFATIPKVVHVMDLKLTPRAGWSL